MKRILIVQLKPYSSMGLFYIYFIVLADFLIQYNIIKIIIKYGFVLLKCNII